MNGVDDEDISCSLIMYTSQKLYLKGQHKSKTVTTNLQYL